MFVVAGPHFYIPKSILIDFLYAFHQAELRKLTVDSLWFPKLTGKTSHTGDSYLLGQVCCCCSDSVVHHHGKVSFSSYLYACETRPSAEQIEQIEAKPLGEDLGLGFLESTSSKEDITWCEWPRGVLDGSFGVGFVLLWLSTHLKTCFPQHVFPPAVWPLREDDDGDGCSPRVAARLSKHPDTW